MAPAPIASNPTELRQGALGKSTGLQPSILRHQASMLVPRPDPRPDLVSASDVGYAASAAHVPYVVQSEGLSSNDHVPVKRPVPTPMQLDDRPADPRLAV